MKNGDGKVVASLKVAQNNDKPVRDLFLIFSHKLQLIIFLAENISCCILMDLNKSPK